MNKIKKHLLKKDTSNLKLYFSLFMVFGLTVVCLLGNVFEYILLCFSYLLLNYLLNLMVKEWRKEE